MAAMDKNVTMRLTNLISDAYLELFNTPTFQKASYFDKSDYILTASGNKVSKRSILCGMKNIHMLGKSIIKNEAILRGDLNNLYFGKYVIIGSKTLICPCLLSREDAETDETTVSSDVYLSGEKKTSNTAEDEEEEEKEKAEEEEDEEDDGDEVEQEKKTEDVDEEVEKKRKMKKLHSGKFQTFNKEETDSNMNNTIVLKKQREKSKCEYSYLTVTIGDNVYIGNDCIVKAAFIGNNVVIGDKCVIGERVIIKDNVMIEDNTIVPNDIVLAPFSKYSGCPAKFVKELPESAEMFLKDYSYMHYKKFLTKRF